MIGCVLGKSDQVMRNPGSRCLERVSKCSIFSELANCWAFLTGMSAELTARGVEIEPHIVLL